INSVINLAFDHLHLNHTENGNAAMEMADSTLPRIALLRWRFEIRLLACRAQKTLMREDALDLLQLATRRGARKYIVTAHTLLARIAMAQADFQAADSELKTAMEILREYPAPLVAWRALARIGQLQGQLGNTEAEQAAFLEAASVIRYIADQVPDQRL